MTAAVPPGYAASRLGEVKLCGLASTPGAPPRAFAFAALIAGERLWHNRFLRNLSKLEVRLLLLLKCLRQQSGDVLFT